MQTSRTPTRFLLGLCALIALGLGIRLMYGGLQAQLRSSPTSGVVAFVAGLLCFVVGLLVGVLLLDSSPRQL